MAKKKTSLSQTLFGEINPYGAASEPAPAPAGPPATLALDQIRPDPGQPRQLLPPPLHQAVTEGRLSPAETLAGWLRQAESDKAETAARHNAQELRRLAASIEQHGLINPITVRQPRPGETLPPGAEYFIVTGERRYWSHVLLALEERQIREGHETTGPDRIKALVANEGVSIRAHQLIENLMREDINAVERARGLWALRFELSGVNHGSPLAGEPEAEDEVNHSSPGPDQPALVPWSQVEAALGISKRYRIFVTSVLNLAPEAQKLVVGYDLSERVIRPIVQKLKDRPALQLEALRQLVAWREEEGETGPGGPVTASVQVLVDQLLAREAAQPAPPGQPEAGRPGLAGTRPAGAEQFRSKVQGALRFLNRLEEPDLAGLIQDLAATGSYSDLVEDLRDLRERINMILAAIPVEGGKKE